ncbi:MAG TPA: transglutaminase-like cysteine peptidase [Stellaceae bacterium]|nr:transglutaminase-like cysteine peptidase [Stellaceae bacterium]
MRRCGRLMLLLLLFAAPAAALAANEAVPVRPVALFGTREVFSADSSAFYKWHGVMRRFAAERQDASCAGQAAAACAPAEWRALVASLQGLDLRAKIERANAAINRHPYVPSWVNWHESNYWETPYEFLRKGGQCQDYAVAKYLLLRAAGVSAERMRVVVLRDTRLGLDHAVTVAYVDGEALLLDNLRRAVVPAASAPEYEPYYSINERGWWLHEGPHARYAALR